MLTESKRTKRSEVGLHFIIGIARNRDQIVLDSEQPNNVITKVGDFGLVLKLGSCKAVWKLGREIGKAKAGRRFWGEGEGGSGFLPLVNKNYLRELGKGRRLLVSFDLGVYICAGVHPTSDLICCLLSPLVYYICNYWVCSCCLFLRILFS